MDKEFAHVQEIAFGVDEIAAQVYEAYTHDLDEYVHTIETHLNQGAELSDQELQRIVVRLPILLYHASSGLVRATLEAEIAKAAAAHLKAEMLLVGPASLVKTAVARAARADLDSEPAWRLVDLTKYVQGQIKCRIEHGTQIYE